MAAIYLLAASFLGGPSRHKSVPPRARVRAVATVDPAVLKANEALHAASCERSDLRYRPTGAFIEPEGLEWERFSFPAAPDTYKGIDALPPRPFTTGDLARVSTRAFLTGEQCATLIAEAEAVGKSAWDLPAAVDGAAATYARRAGTTLEVYELSRGCELFKSVLLPSLFPAVVSAFADALCELPPSRLRVQAAFVVKYNASAGQTELGYHRDGPLVTATVALNSPSEYEGGGTLIEALGWPATPPTPLRLPTGHVLLHPGNVRHGGAPISAGLRYILVCFMYDAAVADHARLCTMNAQGLLAAALRKARGSKARRRALEAAAAEYRNALACGAGDKSEAAHVGLGQTYFELVSYDGPAALAAAVENLEAAAERAPFDAHTLSFLSTACLAAGLKERALKAATDAVAADPASAVAHNNRGLILDGMGKPAQALEAFAEGLRLEPSNTELLVNFGVSSYDLGRADTAVRCFRTVLELDPKHRRAADNLAQLQLAGLG